MWRTRRTHRAAGAADLGAALDSAVALGALGAVRLRAGVDGGGLDGVHIELVMVVDR